MIFQGRRLFGIGPSSVKIAPRNSMTGRQGSGDIVIPDTVITITTIGATFAPVIQLDNAVESPTVLWTFDDETTSDSLTPNKNFGGAGTHVTTLRVSPANALRTINFGYNGDDGGSPDFDFIAQQNVAAVSGLPSARALTVFAASRNPLEYVSFAGMSSLRTVELFEVSVAMTGINLSGCTGLRRLCVEGCGLPALDISPCYQLEDLRGAVNAFSVIGFGTTAFNNLWHICVRQNNLDSLPSTGFPALKDYWAWNCGLTGDLVIDSDEIESVYVNDNDYTSLDMSAVNTAKTILKIGAGGNNLSSVLLGSNSYEEIYLNANPELTGIDLTGQTHIQRFNVSGCGFTEEALEAVLEVLDASGMSSAQSYDGVWASFLGGTNAVPNAAAQAYIASLEGKGWTIYTNEATPVSDFFEDFEDTTLETSFTLVNPDNAITLADTGYHRQGLASMKVNYNVITQPNYVNIPAPASSFCYSFAYKAGTLPTDNDHGLRILEICGADDFADVRISDFYQSDGARRYIYVFIYGEAYGGNIVDGQEIVFHISYISGGAVNVIITNADGTVEILNATRNTDNTAATIRIGSAQAYEAVNTVAYFDPIALSMGVTQHPIEV